MMFARSGLSTAFVLCTIFLMSRCGTSGSGMITVPISNTNSTQFLIDPFEAQIVGSGASSVSGVAPQVNVDYATAKAACEASGKRLCSYSEWRAACVGPNNRNFGFQDTHDTPQLLSSVCDVARTENNTPGSLPSATGAHPNCKTEGVEVYDMIGNLAEWTTGSDGTPIAAGVSFYQPISESNCLNALVDPGSTKIDPATKSTDVGFRCCMNQTVQTSSGGGGGGGSVPTFPFGISRAMRVTW